MNVFDIIGPVMIGPSSSHTAGAVRLGLLARAIFGGTPETVRVLFHGSFAETYQGHGTNLAITAGILGFTPDDSRIKEALELAAARGVAISFSKADLGDVHPNTAKIFLEGGGNKTVITGSSIGGGQVIVTRIDRFRVEVSGEYHTLIANYHDIPGVIAKVTAVIAKDRVNIAQMRVSRQKKGAEALMVIESDQPLSSEALLEIKDIPQVYTARLIKPI